MKINYFAVDNFRGIAGGLDNNKIEFKDSSSIFIFGQNNVGKSTFLQAYQFFYEDTTPGESDFHNQDDKSVITFEIEVFLDDDDLARIEQAAPKQKESFKTYLKDGRILKIANSFKKAGKKAEKLPKTWNYGTNSWEEKGYGSIGLHQVFQSCMPKPILIKAMPTEEEAKQVLNEVLKSVAEATLEEKELKELIEAREKIRGLQDKMYKAETISKYQDSINEYFGKVFPDTMLSIRDEKSRVAWTENKLGKEFNLEFRKSDGDGKMDDRIPTGVMSYGHGTIRTAIFTLLLMRDVAEEFQRKEGRKDYMVLFEEPELFLYPGVVKQLRDLIYEVSKSSLPYQVLCASHSPQMIDLSKPKSSLLRMIKVTDGTRLFQIDDEFLKVAKDVKSDAELRQEMYEVLRFNPHICESFYSDEVILVEGPTEEIILRAYVQEIGTSKDVFILNCASVTNIPFYQRVLSKFSIRYNVICDTDNAEIASFDKDDNPTFDAGIQGAISKQFQSDKMKAIPNLGIFRVHQTTFEPAHSFTDIPERLRYTEETALGKPYNANLYWKNVIKPNIDDPEIIKLPIIKYAKELLS